MYYIFLLKKENPIQLWMLERFFLYYISSPHPPFFHAFTRETVNLLVINRELIFVPFAKEWGGFFTFEKVIKVLICNEASNFIFRN